MIFGINTTRDISKLSQITYNNFEISQTSNNFERNWARLLEPFCAGVLYISGPVNSDASLLMKHYKRMEEKLPETFDSGASVRK